MPNRRGFLGSVAGCAVTAAVALGALGGLRVWGASPVAAPLAAMLTLADYAARHCDTRHTALVEDLTAHSDILLDIPWRDVPA